MALPATAPDSVLKLADTSPRSNGTIATIPLETSSIAAQCEVPVLKGMLEDVSGVPASQQRLICRGKGGAG